MFQVTVADAEASFARLIETVRNGEEVVITENDLAVVRLVPVPSSETPARRRPGSAKGKILYMAEDFDAPLDDFALYS